LALRGPSINGVGKSFNGRNAENEHPRGKDEKKMEAWGRAKGKMGWREKLKKKKPPEKQEKTWVESNQWIDDDDGASCTDDRKRIDRFCRRLCPM